MINNAASSHLLFPLKMHLDLDDFHLVGVSIGLRIIRTKDALAAQPVPQSHFGGMVILK